ncbi:MAG: undecaprenyl-diphosphate phosphatase [Gammaproteobacteria bacterium]|nr:undecaprenyl-diphosphate phosphatase [Gammaproteobacteria bacterium]
MDSLMYWKALLLGIIEGLTEFLPISSTGHLIIAADALNFNGNREKTFEISIQLGAILAVCWHYRARLIALTHTSPSAQAAKNFNFLLNLFIAFLPAAMLGLVFHGFIKEHLFTPFNVAIALIVGGVIILLIEQRRYTPRINSVDDMCWKTALKIGLCQAVALIPGTSRSGATIMGGLLFGLSRQTATEFSFFLAIPTMFAATLYDLYKSWHLLSSHDIGLIAVGFTAAFASALLTVKALLAFIAHHSFRAFAWYRIGFGLLVLFYFW